MSALAHVLEAEGLTTICLSLVREHVERTKTPRALHCQFPLGRPLGKPGDPAYQRRVLDAAFALLDETSGPVLVDFPDEINDEAAQPLACKIPPRMDDEAPEAVAEARALRPAYDRSTAGTGHTNVGRLADASGIPALIESFIKITDGTEWTEAGIPDNNLMEASKDIMSYYEEAAVALEGHVPAARAAESWFFTQTASGQLLKDVRKTLKDQGLPFAFYITPATQ